MHMAKPIQWTVALLAVALLGLTACNRAPKEPPAPQVQGVTVDTPKLTATLQTNQAPSVQEQLNQFLFGLRYGDYVKAGMALDKLSSDPAVTEDQKKVVNQVMEQVKQVINNAPKPAQ